MNKKWQWCTQNIPKWNYDWKQPNEWCFTKENVCIAIHLFSYRGLEYLHYRMLEICHIVDCIGWCHNSKHLRGAPYRILPKVPKEVDRDSNPWDWDHEKFT